MKETFQEQISHAQRIQILNKLPMPWKLQGEICRKGRRKTDNWNIFKMYLTIMSVKFKFAWPQSCYKIKTLTHHFPSFDHVWFPPYKLELDATFNSWRMKFTCHKSWGPNKNSVHVALDRFKVLEKKILTNTNNPQKPDQLLMLFENSRETGNREQSNRLNKEIKKASIISRENKKGGRDLELGLNGIEPSRSMNSFDGFSLLSCLFFGFPLSIKSKLGSFFPLFLFFL